MFLNWNKNIKVERAKRANRAWRKQLWAIQNWHSNVFHSFWPVQPLLFESKTNGSYKWYKTNVLDATYLEQKFRLYFASPHFMQDFNFLL